MRKNPRSGIFSGNKQEPFVSMSLWVSPPGPNRPAACATTRNRGMGCGGYSDGNRPPNRPPQTEGPGQDRPAPSGTSVVRSCGHSFEEFEMKRILFSLVVALSIVSLVGCGGGSSTSKPATTTKP